MKKWMALLLACLLCLCAVGAMAETVERVELVLSNGSIKLYPNGYAQRWFFDFHPHDAATTQYVITGSNELDTPLDIYLVPYGQEYATKDVVYNISFYNASLLTDYDPCTAIRIGDGENGKANGHTITLNLSNHGKSLVQAHNCPAISSQIDNVTVNIHNQSGSLTLQDKPEQNGAFSSNITLNVAGNQVTDGTNNLTFENTEESLTPVNSLEPTCDTVGNLEYWTCNKCDMYFLDAYAEKITTLGAVTIQKLPHSLTHVPAKAPTCTEDGNEEYYICIRENCGKLFSDAQGENLINGNVVIGKLGHQLTHVDEVPATCTEDGNIEYYICKCEGCGALFSDAQGKNPITGDVVIGKLGHQLTHVDEVPATCTEDGNIEYYICTREGCGALFSDAQGKNPITGGVVIRRLGHSLTLVPEEPATCTEDGHKAYYACANCQKLFADENATMALAKPQPIPAEGHDFGEDWQSDAAQHWHACDCGERSGVAEHSFITVVDRKPGETEPGEQHEECSVCGYRKAAVSIPAVGKIDLPQTGDSSSLLRWAALLGACCAGLAVLKKRRG